MTLPVLRQRTTEFLSRAQNPFSFEWELEHRVLGKHWKAGSQKTQDVNQCKTVRKAALPDSVGTLQLSPQRSDSNLAQRWMGQRTSDTSLKRKPMQFS